MFLSRPGVMVAGGSVVGRDGYKIKELLAELIIIINLFESNKNYPSMKDVP